MKKISNALISLLLVSGAHADLIVGDDFTDGVHTSWYTSSSSSAIEFNSDSLGLVTGSRIRGIHHVFPTQTLATDGDSLDLSFSFVTPTTVGTDRSGAFRVGVFDTLDRAADLSMNIAASSGSPNSVYGLAGTSIGLPGYMLDLDVNTGPDANLIFREHEVNSATGQLMQTFTAFFETRAIRTLPPSPRTN